MDNRFDHAELRPKCRACVLREEDEGLGLGVMCWDVLGGRAKWPMITICRPCKQRRWIECPLAGVGTSQRPCPAEHMTVRGPVFPTRQAPVAATVPAGEG